MVTLKSLSCSHLLILRAHIIYVMARSQFSEDEVQAARRLVFSAAAAHALPRHPRGKRKAPASGSPSPGPETTRPAKRAKAAGRGAKSGSASRRPSAPAGGGGGGVAPEANAAARGDAGLGPGFAAGSGEAGTEGGAAGDVQPILGPEGGDRHASPEQPDDVDGDAQPEKASGGVKRRRREGDAGAAQEPAAAMCGPALPCTGLAALLSGELARAELRVPSYA